MLKTEKNALMILFEVLSVSSAFRYRDEISKKTEITHKRKTQFMKREK